MYSEVKAAGGVSRWAGSTPKLAAVFVPMAASGVGEWSSPGCAAGVRFRPVRFDRSRSDPVAGQKRRRSGAQSTTRAKSSAGRGTRDIFRFGQAGNSPPFPLPATSTCARFATTDAACAWDSPAAMQSSHRTVATYRSALAPSSPVRCDRTTRSHSALAVGATHACAIEEASGAIRCWGDNFAASADYAGSTTLSGGPYVAVAAGHGTTCAIDEAARVHCFGTWDWAPRGDAFVTLSMHERGACGIRMDGRIECNAGTPP